MKKMDVRALCEKLKRAGVVGAGGAGFPTYAKIGEGIDTVILNCAECEPLLKPHRQLLQKHAGVVLKGLDLLRESVGASRAIVALKPSYTAAAEAARAELDSYPCLTPFVSAGNLSGRRRNCIDSGNNRAHGRAGAAAAVGGRVRL